MKRITKINDNEYISKEVDHTTSLAGSIIELIFYLVFLVLLFVNSTKKIKQLSRITSSMWYNISRKKEIKWCMEWKIH